MTTRMLPKLGAPSGLAETFPRVLSVKLPSTPALRCEGCGLSRLLFPTRRAFTEHTKGCGTR